MIGCDVSFARAAVLSLAILLFSCKSRTISHNSSAVQDDSTLLNLERKKNQSFRPLVLRFVQYARTETARNEHKNFYELAHKRFVFAANGKSWFDIDFKSHLLSQKIIHDDLFPEENFWFRNIKSNLARIGLSAASWGPETGMKHTGNIGLIIPVRQRGVGPTLAAILSFMSPIGEYGPDLTERLANTGFALGQLAISEGFRKAAGSLALNSSDFGVSLARNFDGIRKICRAKLPRWLFLSSAACSTE